MRYVIMANGKGRRWGNYNGIPKHLISIQGETLLQRTTRLVLESDPSAEVVISSANPDYEVAGARRHSPQRWQLEIDRFCYELIEDDTCFLYGDTFYTKDSIETISCFKIDEIQFFGNESSIVAVKAGSGKLMRDAIDQLIRLIEEGAIKDAKGWHLYHILMGMPLEGRDIGDNFTLLEDNTTDFNWPADYDAFIDPDYGTVEARA